MSHLDSTSLQTMIVPELSERLSNTQHLNSSVRGLKYVSGARAAALERMGIFTVRDLLWSIPHRYLDFSQVSLVATAQIGSKVTIIGTVDKIVSKRPKPHLDIVELYVLDQTGVIICTFFRQPWIAHQVKQGSVVSLSGTVEFDYGFKRLKGPFMEVLQLEPPSTPQKNDKPAQIQPQPLPLFSAQSYARVLPIHHTTEGISTSWMRRITSEALAEALPLIDTLPAEFVAARGLMGYGQALHEVHFPHSLATAQQARKRLSYQEVLMLQLALKTRQNLQNTHATPTAHVIDGLSMQALNEVLPFALTAEQKQVVEEILADMARAHPMNRLLLGDVGTGKTIVCAFAMAAAHDTQSQVAMMAPTSVLAAQYAQKLGPVLDAAHISWALVTGATPAPQRQRIAQDLAAGTITVAFGTTALLSDDISFHQLSCVIVDEQHRFGVGQRARLRQKGAAVDLLALTATPIPRTLALTLYGDLDISKITQRPVAGAGITTHVIPPENLDLAYTAINKAIAQGQQAYIICPLVEDSNEQDMSAKGENTGAMNVHRTVDSRGFVDPVNPAQDPALDPALDEFPQNVPTQTLSQAKKIHSATSVAARLARSKTVQGTIGLLTGRMTPAQKDSVMDDFRNKKIDVLVSTTVVEVGVDVPNASVMLVMDADRFGLATLHQLRGRVGRGSIAGTVYLMCAAKQNTPARKRLAALTKTSDGFKLAEYDLRLRHEGDLLGYQQHGTPSLAICDLATDEELISWAHADARALLQEDPQLTSPKNIPLAREIIATYGAYFTELEHR